MLWLALIAAVASVAMTWPVAANLSTDIPGDVGDPLLQAWQVAWGGHELATGPGDFFQSNTFWPLDNSLAFSDALIGYAPAGLVGSGVEAALVRYNLLFLFSFWLAFLGAALLARELGLSFPAAVVAGAAFAFAPWRWSQIGHLHVLSSGGIPLSLVALARGFRLKRPWVIAAGWLVAIWQLSLGFTLGLQLAYLLAIIAAAAAFIWRRQRPQLQRRVVVPLLAGALAFLGAGAAQAIPYFKVVDEHPRARRSLADVEIYSSGLESFAAAPQISAVWGPLTSQVRGSLRWPPEQTLFPGIAIAALAAVGVFKPLLSRRLRIGLGAGVVAGAVLSLGLTTPAYRLLFEVAPGWQGIRTPGRLMTLTTLGLALLAACGADWAELRLRSIRLPAVIWTALLAAVLIDGSATVTHPAAPIPPVAMSVAHAPQLHLPSTPIDDLRYMFWSTDGFPEIVNGHSGFIPESLAQLRREVTGFPDAQSVDALRSLGVATVLVHLDYISGSAWENAPDASIVGLGVTVDRVGRTLVFRL